MQRSTEGMESYSGHARAEERVGTTPTPRLEPDCF